MDSSSKIKSVVDSTHPADSMPQEPEGVADTPADPELVVSPDIGKHVLPDLKFKDQKDKPRTGGNSPKKNGLRKSTEKSMQIYNSKMPKVKSPD